MAEGRRRGRPALPTRAWGILFRTEVEWEVIDQEPASVLRLFTRYALILAAVPALAPLPQHLLLVQGGLASRWTPGAALAIAAMTYATSLICVALLGAIIAALAPRFHGEANLVQAMKLAVYSNTPAWVFGLIGILPIPGFLIMIANAYGLYILALGLARLMKAPAEEAAGYFVTVLFGAFAVTVVAAWLNALAGNALLAGQ